MDKKISNKLKIFSGWIVMIFILFMSSGYSITTITGSDVNTTGNVTGDWIFGTNANITGLYYGNGSALTDIEYNLNQTQTTFEYNMSTPYDTFNFNQTQTTFEYNMTITTFAYNQTNIFDYNQTATNLSFVPYTGASDNVDLGNNNLTLGDVITFRLGEIIDNIVDGVISITGNLNVTQDLTVDTNTLFVDSGNNRVGIGTTTPQNLFNVVGDGNFTGFTTLGDDSAPKIKMKKLTGTTGSTEDSSVLIAHGLNVSKIISWTAIVESATQFYPPGFTDPIEAGKEYYIFTGSNFRIDLHATNSEDILSAPITILVIYEE